MLAQHSIPTLLRDCFEWLQHCPNIASLCCVKNQRCESSRVTLPLRNNALISLTRSGSAVLGRCYVNVRVCACPGRDSKQELEAISRPGKKRKNKGSEFICYHGKHVRGPFLILFHDGRDGRKCAVID